MLSSGGEGVEVYASDSGFNESWGLPDVMHTTKNGDNLSALRTQLGRIPTIRTKFRWSGGGLVKSLKTLVLYPSPFIYKP